MPQNKYHIIRREEIPDESRRGGEYTIKRLGTLPLSNPSNVGLYETTIPAGSKVANHSHATLEEILWFLTPGKMRIDGEDLSISTGDCVYLPPGTFHEIYAGKDKVVLCALKFPENASDKVERPA